MRKFIIISVILILTIFVAACGHIEDINPDSNELATLTMEDLTAGSISSSGSASTSVTRRNRTILTQYEEIDNDVLRIFGGKTSGVKNIMATKLKKGQTLTINVETSVEKGNLALILIDPDRQLLHEFTNDTSEVVEINVEKEGIYFLRMGAESFTGEISASRSFD